MHIIVVIVIVVIVVVGVVVVVVVVVIITCEKCQFVDNHRTTKMAQVGNLAVFCMISQFINVYL